MVPYVELNTYNFYQFKLKIRLLKTQKFKRNRKERANVTFCLTITQYSGALTYKFNLFHDRALTQIICTSKCFFYLIKRFKKNFLIKNLFYLD